MYYVFMKVYIEYFKRFVDLFVENKKELKKYYILSLLVAFMELGGVALIYPFIYKLIDTSGTLTIKNFVLGGLVFCMFLLKNFFMIYYTSLQLDFTQRTDINIRKMFMKYFLFGKYRDISQVSYAEKSQILGYVISNCINNYLLRLLNLSIGICIFVFIAGFLFVKFFIASIVTLLSAVCILYLQTRYFKSKTQFLSRDINEISKEQNQLFNNTLYNPKGLKISKAEIFSFNEYVKYQEKLFLLSKKQSFYSIVPPYVTEPMIITLLLILLAIISFQNFTQPASLIASYALIASAIFRLAPTINRIQTNIVGLHACIPILEQLFEYYERYNLKDVDKLTVNKDFITFNKSLELRSINFAYEEKNVLNNINLTINKGEFIGVAGLSGVGKTTLIDIIAGLLEPQSGDIILDGKVLDANHPTLKIGYIPQDFGIISASIRDNIAWGSETIDDNRVIEVLKLAQIYDFITENFRDGIYTNPFVDSAGLSQGQKQRLAIARALYPNPDIIILDEATSSLDLKTEDEICEVLKRLQGSKTIIAIAHRLSTISNADKVVYMSNGTIEACGTFEELAKVSRGFKELIDLNSTNSVH